MVLHHHEISYGADWLSQTHMVTVEVGDEDFVQLPWPEATPHQLHLTAFPTVKHPEPQFCREKKIEMESC